MITLTSLRALDVRTICLGSHPDTIQSILDYDYMCGHTAPSIVAIISQGRKQERYFWGTEEVEIPVFARLSELSSEQKKSITCFLNVQSGRRVLQSTKDALQMLPHLRIGVLFAEQVPEQHALDLGTLAHKCDVLLVGPASVGLLIPGVLKLGPIGGTRHEQIAAARITTTGNTAIISTSGGMVNELIHIVTESGLRVSYAAALGGDRFPILTPSEAFLLAEADETTQQILYFGELGGEDEYMVAQLISEGRITKKVMTYIAGTVANVFKTPPQFGHAKAMAHVAHAPSETAHAKKDALRAVGVQVFDTLADLPDALRASVHDAPLNKVATARTIGPRRTRLIASHLSGDKGEEMQLLGDELMHVVERNSLASLTLSLLLGQQITSAKLIMFTDYVLRLLVDHGPYVAGAMNTITSARAGKDLVSSLASGLLTIGPRFGGAINESARQWLRGVSEAIDPKEFVDTFHIHGHTIPGIGHKKYRVDFPDPRITALQRLVEDSSPSPYFAFALQIQAITTAKKGTLVVNIDGAIAAMLLDVLSSELKYDTEQLQELVDIEFFNALFILSRSIGFSAHYLDQRRHDEGLLRFSDDGISYLG